MKSVAMSALARSKSLGAPKRGHAIHFMSVCAAAMQTGDVGHYIPGIGMISMIDVIDLDEFTALRKLVQTVEWLGVRSVVAGLRPGIVAYLASAGAPTGALRTSLNLEKALLKVKPTRVRRKSRWT